MCAPIVRTTHACPLLAGAVVSLFLACGPPDLPAGLLKARQLRVAGHGSEAVALLTKLSQGASGDFSVQLELAGALHATGKEQEALNAVGAAIEIDPASLDTRSLRGEILSTLGRDDEALVELRQVVTRDPGRAGIHRTMGIVHARTGRMQQAVNQFEKELAINPADAPTLTEIGIFYQQSGRIPEAVDRLERAVAADPKSARAHRYLGEVRFKQLRMEDGLAEQRQALAIEPADIVLRVDHARALFNYGHPDESGRVLKEALDKGIRDASIEVEIGRQARERLDYDASVAAFGRAIAIDPTLAEAHSNLGKVFQLQGKDEEALAAFREAGRLAPTDPYTYFYIASILSARGEIDEAIGLYEKSLELDPRNPKAHYALGQALMRAGKRAAAQAEFDRHADIMKRLHDRRQVGVATLE
jgi:tetratricopeptide (TPR) repeat protein